MIAYSILDGTKTDINKNVTVRLDETKFRGSIITFDPIRLVNEDSISYGMDVNYLRVSDNTKTDISLHEALSDEENNEFMDISRDIFVDLLQLFKGDIKYDE
jgi:hypothetical protein